MFIRHRLPNLATPPPSPKFAGDSTNHGRPQQEYRRDQAIKRLAKLVPPHKSQLMHHPEMAEVAARELTGMFQGKIFYAMKANPDPEVLLSLWRGGIRGFDVSSIEEIQQIRETLPLSGAELAFMNPVKTRYAIRRAYEDYGVRIMAFDSERELDLIRDTCGGPNGPATDMTLMLRVVVPHGKAKINLNDCSAPDLNCDMDCRLVDCAADSGTRAKFGAPYQTAVGLVRKAKNVVPRIGLAAHGGSNNPDPGHYRVIISLLAQLVQDAGVAPDVIDLGGGFPFSDTDHSIPPTSKFLDAIRNELSSTLLSKCEVWIEPGRILAAQTAHLLVHVTRRRPYGPSISSTTRNPNYTSPTEVLHITDSMHWYLSDEGRLHEPRLLRHMPKILGCAQFEPAADLTQLETVMVAGPTLDSEDMFDYEVPVGVQEGDGLVFLNVGAYGAVFRTPFCRGHAASFDVPVSVTSLLIEKEGDICVTGHREYKLG